MSFNFFCHEKILIEFSFSFKVSFFSHGGDVYCFSSSVEGSMEVLEEGTGGADPKWDSKKPWMRNTGWERGLKWENNVLLSFLIEGLYRIMIEKKSQFYWMKEEMMSRCVGIGTIALFLLFSFWFFFSDVGSSWLFTGILKVYLDFQNIYIKASSSTISLSLSFEFYIIIWRIHYIIIHVFWLQATIPLIIKFSCQKIYQGVLIYSTPKYLKE